MATCETGPASGPAIGPEFGADLGRLLRDLSTLARATALDRETDPRRVLPTIPPAALWRTWPRVLELAADLAAAMPVHPVGVADRAFMFDLADTIETGAPAPRVASVETRGVAGDGI